MVSKNTLLSYVLAKGNYISVPRSLVQQLGPQIAILLTEFMECDNRHYHEHPRYDGHFAFPIKKIQERTGYSERTIKRNIACLIKKELISSKKNTEHKKNIYTINFSKVLEYIEYDIQRERSEKSKKIHGRGQIDTNTGAKLTPIQGPNWHIYLETNSLGNTLSSNNTLPVGSDGVSNETHNLSSKKKDDVPLEKDVLRFLQETIQKAGFKNRLPVDNNITQRIRSAYAFITAFNNKSTRFKYIFEDRKPPINWEAVHDTRTLHEKMMYAIEQLDLARKEGYYPMDKKILPTDISLFLYNPIARSSWFLSFLSHPVQHSCAFIAKNNFRSLQLSESELAQIQKLYHEGWDVCVFENKATKMCKWYRSEAQVVERVACSRELGSQWTTGFGSLSLFLETYRVFTEKWDDWSLSNFGYGNATWNCFVKYVVKNFNGLCIKADPPSKGRCVQKDTLPISKPVLRTDIFGNVAGMMGISQ